MLDENNEWYEPTNVVISEGITVISYAAFNGLESMTSIELPSSITLIENSS